MVVILKDNGNGVTEVLYNGDNPEPYVTANRETIEPLIEAGKIQVQQIDPRVLDASLYTVH